jgi:hypothetical protein
MIHDLRLTNHFKDKKYDKKELGSFYQNDFLNYFISLIVSFIKYKFHKKKIRSYKLYKTKSSKNLYYKFGQISYYNNCKIKDKIIRLNIRFQLLNILFEFDTRSEKLLQIDNNNIISQKDEYYNSKIRLCFYDDKNINALTRKEILELINQIEDLETKIIYLYQIIHYNLINIFNRYKQEKYFIISQDLKFEINNIKHKIKELKYNFKTSNEQLVQEIITLQSERQHTKKIKQDDKIKNYDNIKYNSIDKELFINLINRIIFQKWYVTLIINAEFQITTIALLDSDTDMNCIQKGIIPTKYYEKLHQANRTRLNIKYKIPNAHISNNGICFKTKIILVKDITSRIILRNLFLALFDSFIKTEKRISTEIMRKKILFRFISKQIMFLKRKHKRIKEQLNDPLLQQRIKSFQRKIESEICANISKTFGYNKNHIVQLLYESNFDKKIILTKIRTIQMNQELFDKEIQNLLQKCLKQKSKLPCNYSAFYVQKNIELKTLKWIRYPILPNKRNLLSKLYDATIFSKFNMKSRFWQIRINRYKIAFIVSFKHYEQNDKSFELKNAFRKFQNDMNNIFTPFINFFINNVLILYKQNWKHLHAFVQIINNNGLVISPNKINLSLNNIHFLGHIIVQKIIINKSLQFLDEIKEKNQLQRFIRSLNYISDYYKHFRIICKSHNQKLKKNSPLWSNNIQKLLDMSKSLHA